MMRERRALWKSSVNAFATSSCCTEVEAVDGARAAAAWDVDGGGVAAVGIGSLLGGEANSSPRPASATASLMGSGMGAVRRGGGEGRRSGRRFRGTVEREKEVIFK